MTSSCRMGKEKLKRVRTSPQDYFERIEKRHKQYLETNMVTYLELKNELKSAQLIEQYSNRVSDYFKTKTQYLKDSLTQITVGEQLKQGAVSALMGIGIGSLAGQVIPNPLPAPSNMFSALIGISASKLIYEVWKNATRNTNADDQEAFQKAMQEAGFDNERYNKLSEKVVQLFHFRECLLLGFQDNGINMRDEFKEKYIQGPVNDQALNIAIETYFLSKLNEVFKESFDEIYNIREDEINDEVRDQNSIIGWIKRYFRDDSNRAIFTQQMQIKFMEECVGFLRKQMNEPSFVAKHPYVPMIVSGLIAGAIALGVGAAIVGGPLTITIGVVALVIACVVAVATYFAVKHGDALRFKRDKNNRESIDHMMTEITLESTRLNQLINLSGKTTAAEVEHVQTYNQANVATWFQTLTGQGNPEIARGSASSWVQEYAFRYRHSKLIRIDLKQQNTELVTKSHEQTLSMQESLIGNQSALVRFVKDTERYLMNKEHQEFIQKFSLVNKIRQQVLEMVSVMKPEVKPEEDKLPKFIIDFYTRPVHLGGLGGMEQDLNHARLMTCDLLESTTEAKDSYKNMLNAAQGFNFARTRDANIHFILPGDDDYRAMLGLGRRGPDDRIEKQITPANIRQYLDSSFDFLYSLNDQIIINEDNSNLEYPINNRKEFVIYRMLLLKQLATLADPNNARVNPSVRMEIHAFVREKFHLDSDVVFANILNQSFFLEPDIKGDTITDAFGATRSVPELQLLAECLRMDLAYNSNAISPKMLVAAEAKSFKELKAVGSKVLLGYDDSTTIGIELTSEVHDKITQAIDNTLLFIKSMNEKVVMKKTGALASYIYAVQSQVNQLIHGFKTLEKIIGVNPQPHPYADSLPKILADLNNFAVEIANIIKTAPKAENLERSEFHFGGFSHLAADLSVNNNLNIEDFTHIKPVTAEESFLEELNHLIANHDSAQENYQKTRLKFFTSPVNPRVKEAARTLVAALNMLQRDEEISLEGLKEYQKEYSQEPLSSLIQKHLAMQKVVSIEEFFQVDPQQNNLPLAAP